MLPVQHWRKREDSLLKKLITLPFLILQVWPQSIVCKMLYHYKTGNDEWKEEKAYYERELSTIGKIIPEVSISSGQRNFFLTKKIDSQNCKNLTFKVIFLPQKLSKSLRKKNSLKNINLGQQHLLKSFFDKFNFKNNLLLKLGCKIAIFLNLTTLFEKLQKNF